MRLDLVGKTPYLLCPKQIYRRNCRIIEAPGAETPINQLDRFELVAQGFYARASPHYLVPYESNVRHQRVEGGRILH